MLQVFSDDENRAVFCAYTIQLHQVLVLQFPIKKIKKKSRYHNKNCFLYKTQIVKVREIVSGLRHDFSLIDKVIFAHGAFFHHFDGYFDFSAPFTAPHDSKLTRSELFE